MSFILPKPKLMNEDEVILARDDWERIVVALSEDSADPDLAEDIDDIAAVLAARAEDQAFAAQITAHRGASVDTAIPFGVIKAKLAGAHPMRAWRDHRDWTQLDLSHNSGVGRDLIAQIETRRKSGSVDTLERIARALGVPMEALIEGHDG